MNDSPQKKESKTALVFDVEISGTINYDLGWFFGVGLNFVEIKLIIPMNKFVGNLLQ